MDTVGCVFWLAVYFFYFPYWTSPSYGTTYIILYHLFGQNIVLPPPGHMTEHRT